jgi:predicted metalloprotease with PDZ domain
MTKKSTLLFLFLLSLLTSSVIAQDKSLNLQYVLSLPKPESNYCHVDVQVEAWSGDTVYFKMPKWMPGYYQLMHYAKAVENFSAKDEQGKSIAYKRVNENTWAIAGAKRQSFSLSYDIKADKKFVANSIVDATHAYLVTTGVFMYPDGFLNTPVSVKVMKGSWTKIATGLQPINGKPDEFTAPDFDILYDCPILIGNLEELPPFQVNGIEHRFVGYDLGNFDKKLFMENLKKVVTASVSVIGDIPYKQYTFIAIGPGRGGIEHLNNTTFGFSGEGLDTSEGMNRMMNFLAHEYFHHFNVKRIRPFELGPFDYDKGNNTNLLWVSEGLSVYYEYIVVKKAGLTDERTLLSNFDSNVNAIENNPGRLYQSLAQASYATWNEGPFGTQGTEPGKSISYYDKGPIMGLFLDFKIRHATQNKKSLDDVMRSLYWQYYKKLQRGFTDAEFQQACEAVAGISLSDTFEYVYTTKELDYFTYLGYAGLQLKKESTVTNGGEKKVKFTIERMDTLNPLQQSMLTSWLKENP